MLGQNYRTEVVEKIHDNKSKFLGFNSYSNSFQSIKVLKVQFGEYLKE